MNLWLDENRTLDLFIQPSSVVSKCVTISIEENLG